MNNEVAQRATLALARKQERWETWKAVATIALAAAAITAAAGVATRIFPPPPLTITVHLDPPLTLRTQ